MQLQAVLFVDRVGEFLVRFANHGAFHVAVRQRGARCHALGNLPRFFFKRCGGKHACGDADPTRFIGGQSLPGVKEFRRARQSDNTRQKKRRAEIRIQPQRSERLREHGLIGRNAQIAGQRHAQSPARGRTVHGGNHHLGHRGDRQANFLAHLEHRLEFVHGLATSRIAHEIDVSAGAKSAPRPCQHHGAHGLIFARAQQTVDQRAAQVGIQRVELLGPIQPQGQYGAGAFLKHQLGRDLFLCDAHLVF